MRAWWNRLTRSSRTLVAVAVALMVVVAVVVSIAAVVLKMNMNSEPGTVKATAATPAPSATASAGATDNPETATSPSPSSTALPPARDVYCPAFRQIKKGGLANGGSDEGGRVDLAELSLTFKTLLIRYSAAERVAPLSLRDSYARTLGYLREGKRAVDSNDRELLKALVLNLSTLNASMDKIETKSAKFCR